MSLEAKVVRFLRKREAEFVSGVGDDIEQFIHEGDHEGAAAVAAYLSRFTHALRDIWGGVDDTSEPAMPVITAGDGVEADTGGNRWERKVSEFVESHPWFSELWESDVCTQDFPDGQKRTPLANVLACFVRQDGHEVREGNIRSFLTQYNGSWKVWSRDMGVRINLQRAAKKIYYTREEMLSGLIYFGEKMSQGHTYRLVGANERPAFVAVDNNGSKKKPH